MYIYARLPFIATIILLSHYFQQPFIHQAIKMTLNSHADLAAAEIAFYVPALCLSLFVCYRQGFSKNLGWFYLVLISLLRIIGASCTLYIVTQNNYSASLLETAAITSAIGTTPLLLVLLGFLERINQRMYSDGIPLVFFRPIHLLSLVALILGIVGGVNKADASSYQTGVDCSKAASILFLAVYVALAVISVLTATKRDRIPSAEHTLSLVAIVVLPFILVRVIYTVATSFASRGSLFFATNPNIWCQALMMFLMEAICVALYVWAGLCTPKQTELDTHRINSDDSEASGGYVHAHLQRHHRSKGQQEMKLGDYRPSRLIRNAIQGR